MIDLEQDKVLKFLMDSKTWAGQIPERVDTHISAVFLIGQKAYKLKKAVHLPFVDFSTLPLRHRACRREIEVNRVWAQCLYEGVLAITRQSDGSLALDSTGEIVDYLVVMRRFDAHAGLGDAWARQG